MSEDKKEYKDISHLLTKRDDQHELFRKTMGLSDVVKDFLTKEG